MKSQVGLPLTEAELQLLASALRYSIQDTELSSTNAISGIVDREKELLERIEKRIEMFNPPSPSGLRH